MEKNKDGLACFGLLVVAAVAITVSALMDGWVLATFWKWFVLPVFVGSPNLSIVQAIGIGMVASVLTHQAQSNSKDKSTSEMIVDLIGSVIFAPLFTLFVGWIITLFL